VLQGIRIHPGGAYDKRRTAKEAAAEAADIQEQETQEKEYEPNAHADRFCTDRTDCRDFGGKDALSEIFAVEGNGGYEILF
jgi:hypothetical protein